MSELLPWVDCGDLLAATGARNLTRSGDEYTFSCIGGGHAHGDATPSAGMNATTSLWRCRTPSCGLRGNAVDYLVALRGYTRTEALRVLEERYGGPERSVEAGALQAEIERIHASRRTPDEGRIAPGQSLYDDYYRVNWPANPSSPLPDPMAYMLGRGFSAEILNRWGIGYDDLSDRITIPVYDENGKLVGIKGRAWRENQQPRYLIVGDVLGRPPRYRFHTYHKSNYAFGAHRQAQAWTIICEGELNVIALDQLGYRAVAVAGAEFSDRQRDVIASRYAEAVVFFDGDSAGRAGAKRVYESLSTYMPVYVVLGAGFDAADVLHPEHSATVEDLRELFKNAVPWLLAASKEATIYTS